MVGGSESEENGKGLQGRAEKGWKRLQEGLSSCECCC